VGSWLALFALAFQLVVSFAHVHLDRTSPAQVSALPGAPAATDANTAAQRHGDKSPAIADDYCAICALIHLAGTVVATAPPDLPAPIWFGALRSQQRAEFELTAPARAPFAARAPPVA
jgi:hypothetical protein